LDAGQTARRVIPFNPLQIETAAGAQSWRRPIDLWQLTEQTRVHYPFTTLPTSASSSSPLLASRRGRAMSGAGEVRVILGEVAGVSYTRLFVERSALREILAARETDEVLILVDGGMRIKLSAHAGGQAVIPACAAVRDQIAVALAMVNGGGKS
jgi:hypothetical protein